MIKRKNDFKISELFWLRAEEMKLFNIAIDKSAMTNLPYG